MLVRAPFVALGLLLAAPAMADEPAAPAAGGGGELCQLQTTVTRTSPKRAPIVQTELDCGSKPTDAQVVLEQQVHNAMNVVDALELVQTAGYEILTSTVRDSFNGHAELGAYTVFKAPCCCSGGGCDVKEGEAPAVDALPGDALPADAETPVEDEAL